MMLKICLKIWRSEDCVWTAEVIPFVWVYVCVCVVVGLSARGSGCCVSTFYSFSIAFTWTSLYSLPCSQTIGMCTIFEHYPAFENERREEGKRA